MQDSVRRFFDSNAEAWLSRYFRADFDSISYQDRMAEATRLLDRHAAAAPLRVLDLGCGAGVLSALLAKQGHEVFACDIAAEMCRKTGAVIGPRAVVAGGEQLPFATASFDAVVALGVIGYSRNPQAFLASLRRVLRPGGVLVISSANEHLLLNSVSALISRWPDRCYRWAKARLIGRPLPQASSGAKSFYRSHYNYMDAREFDALLSAQGLTRLGGTGVNFGELRFMGKRVLGDSAAIRLTRRFSALSRRLPILQRFARIYVTAAQAPAVADGAAPSRPMRAGRRAELPRAQLDLKSSR